METIPLFTGFSTFQVVQDFFHQQYQVRKGSGAQLLIGGSQYLLNKERPPFSTVKVFPSTFALPRPFVGNLCSSKKPYHTPSIQKLQIPKDPWDERYIYYTVKNHKTSTIHVRYRYYPVLWIYEKSNIEYQKMVISQGEFTFSKAHHFG